MVARPGKLVVALAAGAPLLLPALPAQPASAALVGATAAGPQTAQTRALAFVKLFHNSCMVYLGQDQALNAALERNGFKILAADAAAQFLQGSTGLAWLAPGRLGELIVALRDDGSCAVIGRQLDAADVQAAFDGLALASASPVLPVVRQPDRVVATSDGPMSMRGYLQGKPSSTSAIQLTLATSPAAAAHPQVIATLSLVERSATDRPSSAAQP